VAKEADDAKSAKQPTKKRAASSSRKRMPRASRARGPEAAEAVLDPADPALAETVERVRAAGGAVSGAYRDPLSGTPLVVASLPLGALEPTPFQRDLSPTHAKRLAARIEETGAFLDPVIAVAAPSGTGFWTPNGRHRLAAARMLGQRTIAALVSVDRELSFKILALNTEKAHNLRDKSLEVIRMARALEARRNGGSEADHQSEFESPALLTLGLLYEKHKRFSGGAYLSLLRKVDRFDAKSSLAVSLRRREGAAARLADIDAAVAKVVAEMQKRGFRSPYLKAYVVARVNPVRWVKTPRKIEEEPPMPLGEALTRMARNIRDFDVSSVKIGDLAMVAAVAPADE
jgi:ParB family chromosome partitioning protein